MLNGFTVVLGVTGGIAAYKAAALCSKLVQAGADVRVIMTRSAVQFITPLTFQTISRHDVIVDIFDEKDASSVSHIDLADRADLVVVAPATANILAKMTYGMANDMLSTTLLATTAPILVAPAMNVHMYEHTAVQSNLKQLRERGIHFIDPNAGQLACGYVGKGRLAEPEQIFEHIQKLLIPSRRLSGKKLLVTAGGTIERLDPVRYLSNDSSGKMGYAIAQAAKQMGAEVTLVSANVHLQPPSGVQLIKVESAKQMYDAVMSKFADQDIVVKAAAVADYRPVQQAEQKIKKSSDRLTIELEKTTDILAELGRHKQHQFIAGFAAETEEVAKHAVDKLKRKNCDLIFANNVSEAGAGFGSETNRIVVFDAQGEVEAIPMMQKQEAAVRLLNIIIDRLPSVKEDQ
jgi:phosphopantothenoylcysteine decarboxylase/phosphopantothenate--cysteine ligase